jgi:predicted GNAT family acetyltransferase
MNIYHTHVSEELKGQNIGQQLVEAGVAYARQHQLKIIPSCSYARTVFARHKELQDVLA